MQPISSVGIAKSARLIAVVMLQVLLAASGAVRRHKGKP